MVDSLALTSSWLWSARLDSGWLEGKKYAAAGSDARTPAQIQFGHLLIRHFRFAAII